ESYQDEQTHRRQPAIDKALEHRSLLLMNHTTKKDSNRIHSGRATAQLRATPKLGVLARLARADLIALRLERPRRQPPVVRTDRLVLGTLRGERPRQAAVARSERGADRCQMDEIALRVAAANAVRAAADRQNVFHRLRRPARSHLHDREGNRQAHGARVLRVGTDAM